MAVFLSASRLEETVAALREHYPGETAAAIVQRASWPQEKVLRGTLATIATAARGAGIERTAMILVGDVLRNEGEASLLYDRTFSHGYRRGESHSAANDDRQGEGRAPDDGFEPADAPAAEGPGRAT